MGVWTFVKDLETWQAVGLFLGILASGVVVLGGVWNAIEHFWGRKQSSAERPERGVRSRSERFGWAIVALITIIGSIVLLAANLGGRTVSATDGGLAIGGDVVNSDIRTNR
ncbi:hypothetical protein ACTZWW_21240 [Salinarimonas sp. NSM]|uniref:hypothetical protein n=1 Tax=Salinarimonas sp. NSM TaxID=3458003 RepID=UPI0040374623